MSEAHFSALFPPDDNSLTIRDLLNNNRERRIRENSYAKDRSAYVRRGELQQREGVIDAKRKREETEKAAKILNALDEKRWPTHARDSLDAMLDRSDAASSSVHIVSSRVPPTIGNFQLSRKRESVAPLADGNTSLTQQPLKRFRLNESSPFDTLNTVRRRVLSHTYPHTFHLQSPSLYARESLENIRRLTHSLNESSSTSTVSNYNSESNDVAESFLPLVTKPTALQIESSVGVGETSDSPSLQTSEPLSDLETDELALPVQPLFSKISFKKVSPPCINFSLSESDFAKSSEVSRGRLKHILGQSSGKSDSGWPKPILKKHSIEPVTSIPSTSSTTNNFADSSTSQTTSALKFSPSLPTFSATPSFASNNEPNIFTATPLTSGSKSSSLSNARRKIPRR